MKIIYSHFENEFQLGTFVSVSALGSNLSTFPKVFSFEKNSKGENPPGPLSFVTLDSKTEEELPSRLELYFGLIFWKFQVCPLLVPFPWELGQCWAFPHLRIRRGTLVHCQGLGMGGEGNHRPLGVLPHCQVGFKVMLSLRFKITLL